MPRRGQIVALLLLAPGYRAALALEVARDQRLQCRNALVDGDELRTERIDALRAQLVTVNQRIAALQALIARNLERERRAIARREQKQSDDLASTRHVRRSDDTPTR